MAKKNKPPAKMGAPGHQPNAVTRKAVQIGAAFNMTRQQLAQALGIERHTFTKHYDADYEAGQAQVNMVVANAALRGIMAGDTQLIKHYLNNKMGFKDKIGIEHDQAPEPIADAALREFNSVIVSAIAGRIPAGLPSPVQNRPILSPDGDNGPEGHETPVAVRTVPGDSEQS